MDEDLISPATPENGGDEESTANNAGNKHCEEPEKKFCPSDTSKGKNPALTKKEWGGFLGDLFVILYQRFPVWVLGFHIKEPPKKSSN